MSHKLTKQEFVDNSIKNHPNIDYYDYSLFLSDKFDFKGLKYNAPIICHKKDKNGLEHGIFRPIGFNFMNGTKCRKCINEENAIKYSKGTEQFIKEARKIHGDKYDYSKVNYVNWDTEVIITCPIHGDFKMTPMSHLTNKSECQKCAIEKRTKARRKTFEQFVEQANKIHQNKYQYHDYINDSTPIKITCSKHGDFLQTPSNHLQGKGCPMCNTSKLESEVEQMLIENKIKYIHLYRKQWLGLQSLDFYLPDYKIGIECQGLQHFESIKYFGGDEGFKRRQLLDKRKLEKCKNNNVKLLYYSKEKITENIDNIINEKTVLLEEILKSKNN